MHKISVSLYHKELQISCHLTTGRNNQDFSLEKGLLEIVYCTKISVSLYHMGRQFSCHHITGRNVQDLSLENGLTQIVYCTKISVQFIPYGEAVQLPPYYR